MQLSEEDSRFMLERLDLPASLQRKLELRANLSEEEADELREWCADRLQTHGFDSNYNPTADGRRWEDLIDKLYTG